VTEKQSPSRLWPETYWLKNIECCFVLLTRGWEGLQTRPPIALGSSPELFAFHRFLQPFPLFPHFFFEIKRLPLYFFEIGHQWFPCFVSSDIGFSMIGWDWMSIFPIFGEIRHNFEIGDRTSIFSRFFEIGLHGLPLCSDWALIHHFWDQASPQSEIGHWSRTLKPDLTNAEKSKGKKISLKRLREKRVYINLRGLWSDPYDARWLRC